MRFTPYGEYAEAFLLTAEFNVEGLSGMAGGPEVEEEDVGNGLDDGGATPANTVICQSVLACIFRSRRHMTNLRWTMQLLLAPMVWAVIRPTL